VPTIRDLFRVAHSARKAAGAPTARASYRALKRAALGVRVKASANRSDSGRFFTKGISVTELITSIVAIGALLVSVWFNYQTNETARDQLDLTKNGQFADRFAKEVEQLGSPNVNVRIGAIYSLEQLRHEYQNDQPTIDQVLAAYVRQKIPRTASQFSDNLDLPPGNSGSRWKVLDGDVFASLDTLGRRQARFDNGTGKPSITNLFLAGADLRKYNMSNMELSFSDFRNANLAQATLTGASLVDTNLTGVELSPVDLRYVDLRGAHLTGADLRGDNLTGADLEGAVLDGADMRGTILTDANLDGVDLRNTKILPANLIGAYLGSAQLPPGMARPVEPPPPTLAHS
jgi:uncharacterized protein YjbI with pentapeptide repeats